MSLMQECYNIADSLIEELKSAKNMDYSPYREELAEEFDTLYRGFDDTHTSFDTLPNVWIIQEDHYDQHMDEDENKPEWETMICMVNGFYVFPSY